MFNAAASQHKTVRLGEESIIQRYILNIPEHCKLFLLRKSNERALKPKLDGGWRGKLFHVDIEI